MIVNRIAEPEPDGAAIARVVEAAFDQPDEAELVARLRADGAMAIELVAVDGEAIVGHIAFSRLVAPAGAIALAPVAVSDSLPPRLLTHRVWPQLAPRGTMVSDS
jgi:putative acetyltransferase